MWVCLPTWNILLYFSPGFCFVLKNNVCGKLRFPSRHFFEVSLFHFNKESTKNANWKDLVFFIMLFLGNRAKAGENKFMTMFHLCQQTRTRILEFKCFGNVHFKPKSLLPFLRRALQIQINLKHNIDASVSEKIKLNLPSKQTIHFFYIQLAASSIYFLLLVYNSLSSLPW